MASEMQIALLTQQKILEEKTGLIGLIDLSLAETIIKLLIETNNTNCNEKELYTMAKSLQEKFKMSTRMFYYLRIKSLIISEQFKKLEILAG